eukprot:4283524-Heterocapsa_arctica.AAC.1
MTSGGEAGTSQGKGCFLAVRRIPCVRRFTLGGPPEQPRFESEPRIRHRRFELSTALNVIRD